MNTKRKSLLAWGSCGRSRLRSATLWCIFTPYQTFGRFTGVTHRRSQNVAPLYSTGQRRCRMPRDTEQICYHGSSHRPHGVATKTERVSAVSGIGTTTKKRRKVWGAWMYRLEAPSNSAFGRAIGSRKLKRNKVALQFRHWWRHIKLQRCYCCKIVATGIKKG